MQLSLKTSSWAFALGLVVLCPRPAAASSRTVRLSYVRDSGAEQCPDERWIRQAVTARLGFDPFKDDADVRVEARVSRASKGLAGSISVTDTSGKSLGRRDLTSVTGDCLELASAMELAIAISVDPQYLSQPAPLPPPAPAPLAPVVPAPVAVQVPAAAVVTSAAPDFHAGVGFFASGGISPFPVPGLVLHASLRWSRFILGLEGRADLGSSVSLGGGKIGSSVLLGSIVPCVRLGPAAVCALASFGALQVTADLVVPTHRESSPLILAGTRALVDIRLSQMFSLQPFAEVQAVLTRTTVRWGDQPVWTTFPVTGAAGLALDIHFF